MRFSVIIPTRDRPDLLEKVLNDLEKQAFPKGEFEVIVIDDGSNNRTKQTLRIFATSSIGLDLHIYPNRQGEGPAKARNLGISLAKGDWIAFTDDDVEIPSNWLEIANDRISKYPDIVGIEGKVTTDTTDPLFHSAQNVKGRLSRKYEGFLTANMFYRKSILTTVGGFSEVFPRAFREDSDLAFKMLPLGRIPYCNDLQVHHPARKISIVNAIKREMRHESDPLLYKRHPEIYPCLFAWTNLLWLGLILAQVVGAFLGLLVPWNMFEINVCWFVSVASILVFFIVGKGLSRGLYRWIGSYVRFIAFLRGSILYDTAFPIFSLALKARKFKPVLTDNI